MHRSCFILAALMALPIFVAPTPAAAVTIKLGTLAPDGSSWDVLLKEMATKWSAASSGSVKLKIFGGGVAGDEGDMVRKLRIGQLHAAALTVVGLHDIHTAPQAISAPGLIADDAEWKHVFEKVTPIWEARLQERGFVVLMWGDTGWVHMFLRKPVRTPEEMRGLKVFAWSGDPASVNAWKLAGFVPVVISATDILPSLSTGMIDGFGTTPVMALTARWYEYTPYMTSTAWGHLPGATVVRRESWEQIPPATQAKLLAIAREYGVKVNAEVERLQRDAIAAMQKNGLKVLKLDPVAWNKLAEKSWPAVRGGVVTEAEFDEVKSIRDAYRAGRAGNVSPTP